MKFLINSVYFRAKLIQAFNVRAHRFVVVGKSIKFVCPEKDIEMDVEFLERMDLDIEFNWHTWSKVIQFLWSIPEQPLTVRIWDDQIDIYNVKTFVSRDA